ncbi:MAG: hypothetical protein FWF07_00220 [Methanomassiliicoccaceae archaeon]|nr:hypothetical protein [Methanomassiliicoccaceae archaeon]
MSDNDKKYTDPELERFLRENKEMVMRLFKEEKDMMENLFKEEKGMFRGACDEEKARAEEFAEKGKDKAKEKAQEVFNAFTDPEVQKHFMAMGLEFMMGMSALVSAMPFPDGVKDMADKAKEARKKSAENFSKANADRSKGSDSAAPEKINIQPAVKKKSPPKAKKEE